MPADPRIARFSRAMFAMADHFHRKGAKVDGVDPMKPLSNPERVDYLEFGNVLTVNGRPVSIKALDCNFTGPKDWPRKQQCFVCSKDEHERDPCALYVTVSRDLKHAAVVKASTRTKWFPVQRRAHEAGELEWFQVCPIEHVEFIKVECKETLGA